MIIGSSMNDGNHNVYSEMKRKRYIYQLKKGREKGQAYKRIDFFFINDFFFILIPRINVFDLHNKNKYFFLVLEKILDMKLTNKFYKL